MIWLLVFGSLAYRKTSKTTTSITITLGFFLTLVLSGNSILIIFLAFIIPIILAILYLPHLRKQWLVKPTLNWLQHHLPKISETESIAIDAGTVGWDAELFTGSPTWQSFFNVSKPQLTKEERDFLDGPVEQLCKMIDDWDICHQNKGLSPNLWQFLKTEGFFALIIPKSYGGLEFSALAHSEILSKIASRSLTVAAIVSVPNSLGPSELILKYGTHDQKNYYLPRLAKGIEIPCFALTSLTAGSDANAIQDRGIVCRGDFNGENVLGIRLNWNKRYTTLAPIATLIGLAFKLSDPEHLLSDKKELGITCALVPANLSGVSLGQYHLPLNAGFPNGPILGKDVFIPLDAIIGGLPMAGHGWRMLVECLSAGRAISLPSSVAGCMKMLAGATGAYAAIRRQFKQAIGHFEGIEDVLARMIANAYLADAARLITAAYIDNNESPTVIGAIVKTQLTERARQITIDAMDIHAGKAIMMGPKNYIALPYQNVPICITVEGANILTRSMIIFGQGVIRAHPFLLLEMQTAKKANEANKNNAENKGNIASANADYLLALDKFDQLLMQHVLHFLNNISKSFWRGLILGCHNLIHPFKFIFKSKKHLNSIDNHLKNIDRASSAFAVLADFCLMYYGGKLKTKEKISGRLADCLSLMYLASCALKHFDQNGRPVEDKPLIDWIVQDLINNFWQRVEEIVDNLPKLWVRIILRVLLMPLGKNASKPSDKLGHHVARLLLYPNPTRDRILQGVYLNPDANNEPGKLELVLAKVLAAENLQTYVNDAASDAIKEEAEKLRAEMLMVDSFD